MVLRLRPNNTCLEQDLHYLLQGLGALLYASCGWSFDDISEIVNRNVIDNTLLDYNDGIWRPVIYVDLRNDDYFHDGVDLPECEHQGFISIILYYSCFMLYSIILRYIIFFIIL